MTNENKPLSEIIKEKHVTSVSEHILNAFKAVLSSAPFCGGIASLMNDYIPNSKQKRLEKFAKKVAEDLDNLKDKIDESSIFNDEYAHIFEECFRGVVENYHKEKLDAFRGILVNSTIGININENEKDFYLNLVNNLSVLHIRIIKFMSMPIKYLDENNIPHESIQGGFNQFFPIAIPDVNLEAIKSAYGDLYQYGMINTDKSIFGTMTSGKGLDLLGQDGSRVTPFGKSFIEFCTSPCD